MNWMSNWEKIQFIKFNISNWRIGKIQCRYIGDMILKRLRNITQQTIKNWKWIITESWSALIFGTKICFCVYVCRIGNQYNRVKTLTALQYKKFKCTISNDKRKCTHWYVPKNKVDSCHNNHFRICAKIVYFFQLKGYQYYDDFNLNVQFEI